MTARLVDAEGEQASTSEALLSVEYDAEGAPRRLGLELWTDPDSSPLRVAADRADDAGPQSDREPVSMRFRLDGIERPRPLRGPPPFVSAPAPVKAVISDFGGVLTTPLLNSFGAIQDEIGIEAGMLGRAMQRIAERDGEHPLYELERGRIAETEFLGALRHELGADLGHEPELHRFATSTSRRSTSTSR